MKNALPKIHRAQVVNWWWLKRRVKQQVKMPTIKWFWNKKYTLSHLFRHTQAWHPHRDVVRDTQTSWQWQQLVSRPAMWQGGVVWIRGLVSLLGWQDGPPGLHSHLLPTHIHHNCLDTHPKTELPRHRCSFSPIATHRRKSRNEHMHRVHCSQPHWCDDAAGSSVAWSNFLYTVTERVHSPPKILMCFNALQ